MTYLEAVVFGRLRRTAVARHLGHASAVGESVCAARQHLVRIYLMRYVEHDSVFRHVEDIVQGYRRLNKSEVRAHVSTYHTVTFEYATAYFCGKQSELFGRHALDVGRRFYIFQ